MDDQIMVMIMWLVLASLSAAAAVKIQIADEKRELATQNPGVLSHTIADVKFLIIHFVWLFYSVS